MQFFLLLFFPHKMGVHKQRKKKTTFFVWMSVSSFSFEKKKKLRWMHNCSSFTLNWHQSAYFAITKPNKMNFNDMQMVTFFVVAPQFILCPNAKPFFSSFNSSTKSEQFICFLLSFLFLFNSEEVQQWKFT